MKSCDCLNYCGDDPALRSESVKPCNSMMLRKANIKRLNTPLSSDAYFRLADELVSYAQKIQGYTPRSSETLGSAINKICSDLNEQLKVIGDQ